MSHVYRITLSCLVTGQTCQNVFHLEDPSESALPATIANSVAVDWISWIKPFQHAGALWVDVEVRRVSPSGPAPFHQTVSIAGTGGSNAQTDLPFACRVLQFQTLTAGPHGHGRYSIPGTSSGAWDNGIVKTSSLAAGAALVDQLENAWIGPLATTNLFLVIAPRSNPSAFIRVTNIVQRTRIGTVRTRGIGIGI